MTEEKITVEGEFALTLGELIRIYRGKEDFTQRELAKLLGISVGTMVNYEKDKTVPDIETLGRICRILRIPSGVKFGMQFDEVLTFYCPKDEFLLDDDGNALGERFGIKSDIFKLYGCTKYNYSCLKQEDKVYLLYNDVNVEAGGRALVKFSGSHYFVIADYDGKCYTNILTKEMTDKIDFIAARVLGEIEDYVKIE